MKRVTIAIVLLAVVAVMSGAALWWQQRTTEALLTACDEIITLYESGDIAACREATADLTARLEDDTRLFPFFLRHERMESVFQQAAALPHLVDDNDPADLMAGISSVRMQLQILMDNEWPSPENIL